MDTEALKMKDGAEAQTAFAKASAVKGYRGTEAQRNKAARFAEEGCGV